MGHGFSSKNREKYLIGILANNYSRNIFNLLKEELYREIQEVDEKIAFRFLFKWSNVPFKHGLGLLLYQTSLIGQIWVDIHWKKYSEFYCFNVLKCSNKI